MQAQTATPTTPDEVWAILKRVGERQEKMAQLMEESKIEYDRRIGHLDNLFGEMTESMLAPKLRENFRELGFDFPSANSNTKVDDYVNDIHFEVDVKLENGDKALLVEVKTKLTTEDVKDHIERLEKMRKYADLHGDKRTFLGAVAGVVMTSNVKEFALGQGFYVIEPSGETFNITPPKNKPKEW